MVSIIIPSFNAAATIELAIISVLQQDNDDVEIVVIDGKSTDGTLTILDDISFRVNAGAFGNKLFRYVSETDKGIYDAMNKGIELSRGDWLFFLGADDILLPDFSVACNYLLLNNVVYYCNTFLINTIGFTMGNLINLNCLLKIFPIRLSFILDLFFLIINMTLVTRLWQIICSI
nr:glycosyltransferase [Bacteroides fragilis]